MKVNYALHDIRFEWNSHKASINLRKHGVSFEVACEAFFDPFLRVMDIQQENGEFREAIVGMTTNWKLLYVVYSIREEDIFRIISARRTTKSERRFYEDY